MRFLADVCIWFTVLILKWNHMFFRTGDLIIRVVGVVLDINLNKLNHCYLLKNLWYRVAYTPSGVPLAIIIENDIQTLVFLKNYKWKLFRYLSQFCKKHFTFRCFTKYLYHKISVEKILLHNTAALLVWQKIFWLGQNPFLILFALFFLVCEM